MKLNDYSRTSALIRPDRNSQPKKALSEQPERVGSNQNTQFDLHRICESLVRSWPLILSIVFAVLLLVALTFWLFVKPTYEPVARIVIDPPGAETFSLDVGIPSSDSANYLETQAAILKSDGLAVKVIRQLHLDTNSTFVGDLPRNNSHNGYQGTATTLTHMETVALNVFQQNLVVSLFRNSRLMEVRFASHDPELAALIANTLINVFVEENYQTKYEAITKSSEWLTRQLDDVRKKVEESNQSLAEYESKIGFLDANDKQNVVADKLADLNHQLTEAQSDRIQLEAYVNAMHQGDVDAIPELRNNEIFRNTTEQYLEVRAQLAEESAVFGKNNPRVKKLQSEVTQFRTGLTHSVEASYRSAQARERMMAQALGQMKTIINTQNAAMVRLNFLKREAVTNAELYNTLFTKVREAGIVAASKSSNVRVVDFARILDRPTRPNRLLYLLVALFLGISGAIMMVLVKEVLNNRVRTEEDVTIWTGLPLVGIVPQIEGTGRRRKIRFRFSAPQYLGVEDTPPLQFVCDRPSSIESEAVRNLRTNILLSNPGRQLRTILIASSSPREGKTTVAVNLAITLAKHGQTCLIDADMRRPKIAKLFGVGRAPGLSDVLLEESRLDTIITRSPVENLSIIPAGKPTIDPGELASSHKMHKLIETLIEQFEYLVIDSAPVLPFSDARVLATLVDGVVLVGRYGSTTQQALKSAAEVLQDVYAPLIGVVINAVNRLPPYYNYYSIPANSSPDAA